MVVPGNLALKEDWYITYSHLRELLHIHLQVLRVCVFWLPNNLTRTVPVFNATKWMLKNFNEGSINRFLLLLQMLQSDFINNYIVGKRSLKWKRTNTNKKIHISREAQMVVFVARVQRARDNQDDNVRKKQTVINKLFKSSSVHTGPNKSATKLITALTVYSRRQCFSLCFGCCQVFETWVVGKRSYLSTKITSTLRKLITLFDKTCRCE